MAVALSNEERDWMWLPDIIMASISSYLFSSHDYVRFSCVCKRWHSVAKDQIQRHMTIAQVPFLLLPPKDCDDGDQLWSVYGVTQGQPRKFKLTIPYDPKTCIGSSHGWLAFLGTDFCRVTLFNPFTKGEISLPPLIDSANVNFSNRYQLSVANVILSANPYLYGNNYTVAAIICFGLYGTLALIRPGRDEKWTHLNTDKLLTGDMIFSKNGKWVYAAGIDELVRANIKLPTEAAEWEMVVLPHLEWPSFVKWSLVEASRNGDLLMVSVTSMLGEQFKRKVIEVQGSSVVEVDDLNGDAILVGQNNVQGKNVCVRNRLSSRVAARDFKGIIEPNCVYVFNYKRRGDSFKYNVKQGGDDPASCSTVPDEDSPCRIWISPTLNL